MIGGIEADVDLSRPEFERAVLGAAGRFRALRRKSIGRGGKPPKPVTCGTCNVLFGSQRAYRKHACERWENQIV